MTESTLSAEPKVKHKTFSYRTSLEWVGGRAGIASSAGKPSFRVASPPEFKGEPDVWTPEDLFVLAVELCTMTTFAAFAQRLGLPIESYASDAEGVLEFVDGGYRMTRVTLRPTIVVPDADAVRQVEVTLREAHRACIVSNSIKSSVALEPLIRVSLPSSEVDHER